jgi:hypothetical protein
VDVQVGVEHSVVVRSSVIVWAASAQRLQPIRSCHAVPTPAAGCGVAVMIF